MKALTLTQPWASLIALGHKTIETRSWKTSYRGPLLIHAAKTIDKDFATVLGQRGLIGLELPLGEIVAYTELIAIASTDDLMAGGWVTDEEQELGDFGPGRFGWILANRVAFNGLAYTGHLGLWDAPVDGVVELFLAQHDRVVIPAGISDA